MTEAKLETSRTRVHRHGERGSYDLAQICEILDAGKVCHVACVDDGRPIVLPTAYGRVGASLILHGASDGRFMKTLESGCEICVAITLVDGLVLARSAFHSSMNYRSVVIFGRAQAIVEREEKLRALDSLVEHLVPRRLAEVRPTTETELAATTVVRLPLVEASAKIRTGGPIDAKADLSLPIWAGVLPLTIAVGSPIADESSGSMELPGSVVAALSEGL